MSEIDDPRPSDVLVALVKEDLSRFSRDELSDRVRLLKAEIKRAEEALNSKQGSHAEAEALFKI